VKSFCVDVEEITIRLDHQTPSNLDERTGTDWKTHESGNSFIEGPVSGE